MTNKQKIVSIIILILLAIIIISATILNSKKSDTVNNEQNQTEQEYFEKTIDIKHQYKDGKHIFAGVLEVPTPCHLVDLQINPGEIAELNFSVRDSGGVCAQVVSDANFYAEFTGPQDQLFVGKVNGENVNLNVFEVDADLDINEVDIFTKG